MRDERAKTGADAVRKKLTIRSLLNHVGLRERASFQDEIVVGQQREEKSKVKIKTSQTLAQNIVAFAVALCMLALAAGFWALLVWLAYFFGTTHARDKIAAQSPILGIYEPAIDWGRLPKWTNAANPLFLRDATANAEKFSASPFDQFALGLHERDNGSLTKAYYFLTLASARAHPGGRTLRDQIQLTPQDNKAAMERFRQTLTFGGSEANLLLGMLYLGDKAFELARDPNVTRCDDDDARAEKKKKKPRNDGIKLEPTWPPCEKNFRLPSAAKLPWPNDLLADTYSINESYLAFARASQCFNAEAGQWLNAMENKGWVDQVTAQALRAQASNQVQNGGKREQFCNGNMWIEQRPNDDGRRSAAADPAGYCSLSEGDGALKAQRDRPGRSGYNAADDAEEAPLCSSNDSRNPLCDDSAAALQASDEARVCLRMGDAMVAAGDVDFALQYYRAAIARGRKYGAQASVVAGDRMRALSLTCEYTTASLARIGRGETVPDFINRDFINIVDRQRALKALGNYSGAADGKWGEQTREAVRSFQRELGFDETGALSPLETVVLICQAAEGKGDSDSQNLLGVMYLAGLGVVQNTDLALQWLNTAARRGNADAYYNLAITYATGTILASYRLCDARFNDELAEAYYLDARRLGHPNARVESFAAFKSRIVSETNTNLEIVTPSCGPDQANTTTGQNK
ncbi:MAG: peptidoglycan-binding protein [Parvularculaceae bacterium]